MQAKNATIRGTLQRYSIACTTIQRRVCVRACVRARAWGVCVCVEGVAGQVTPKGSPVPESRLAQVFACVCVRVCVRVRVVRACARARPCVRCSDRSSDRASHWRPRPGQRTQSPKTVDKDLHTTRTLEAQLTF